MVKWYRCMRFYIRENYPKFRIFHLNRLARIDQMYPILEAEIFSDLRCEDSNDRTTKNFHMEILNRFRLEPK